MLNIHEIKGSGTPETPVLLFDCELRDGRVERWATHRVRVGGDTYEARVLRHNSFEMKAGSEEGIDAAGRFVATLDNVDGYVSQLERSVGLKGAKLKLQIVFIDVESGEAVTEPGTVFLGAANPPEELAESFARLSFTSRLGLQRVAMPQMRIQPRCPWAFPRNEAERAEAASGGAEGRHSRFFGCGYSPGVEGGAGNEGAEGAFASCGGTKTECEARGMYSQDAAGQTTARFAGFQFLPPTVMVRAHGDKETSASEAVDGRARSNDVVPLVYGTNWYQPTVVFSRSDGNLTHCEVLLGAGEMSALHTVTANGVEIPLGEPGKDMGATGWYNVVSLGGRNGAFNLMFTDGDGRAIGDPHGSLAVLAVAVPGRLISGQNLPKIEVLADGMKLERYAADGSALGKAFTRNPSWVVLDILRRSGWKLDELDIESFAKAAVRCDELIEVQDSLGNTRMSPRFEVNLTLQKRRSAGEVVRGIRNSAALMLTFDADGRLRLAAEDTLARQQETKPECSNSAIELDGGWPAYEFGDGTAGTTGILRKANGEPALRLWSRTTAECPNRWSVEFQDGFNEYRQDSVSILDLDDVMATGQELNATVPAVGLPHFDQAARVARFHVMKTLKGNSFVEFETGPHALGLRPGDIIGLTYMREGLERAPFRIVRIAPSEDHLTAKIVAQRHEDDWYELLGAGWDGTLEGRRRNGRRGFAPWPLAGTHLDEHGNPLFDVEEEDAGGAGETVRLKVRYTKPGSAEASKASVPIVGLSPEIETTGGTLAGGSNWYYALSALDGDGRETDLSFTVRASVPAGVTNRVTLKELGFAPGTQAFRVYRGGNPAQMLRIAEVEGTASEFTDEGFVAQNALPVDANFDHANFYWRMEVMPETEVTAAGARSLTGAGLAMTADEFRSSMVRVTSGRGAGQERAILTHDGSTFELQTAWTTVPDASSTFVVAEPAWRLGAATRTDQVQFEVPNRKDVFVHISGRAANAQGVETDAEISPLHRYRIGGRAGIDFDTPPMPAFSLTPATSGEVWLTGIGFETLMNTATVESGTLVIRYADETAEPEGGELAGGLAVGDEWATFSGAAEAGVGDLLQIGSELVRVVERMLDGQLLRIERGVLGSTASAHAAGAMAQRLMRLTVVAAFQRDFFGSGASGSYALPITLKCARIAAAEFYVTNRIGDSPTAASCFTGFSGGGLRTYSGGQFTIQVEGDLAAEANVAPAIVVEEKRSVAEIRASVAEAPSGGSVLLRVRANGEPYCDLQIASGTRMSPMIDGGPLGKLEQGTELSLDVLSVPTGAGTRPGRNLTVMIRL